MRQPADAHPGTRLPVEEMLGCLDPLGILQLLVALLRVRVEEFVQGGKRKPGYDDEGDDDYQPSHEIHCL